MIAAVNIIGGKENASGANQLRNDHAFCAINNKSGTVSHPRIIAKENILFFNLAGDFIFQCNIDVERGIVGSQISFGLALVASWLFKIIVFKFNREFLSGIIFNRVEFVKDFTESSFDKFIPAFLLMVNQIRDGKCLVALGKKHAATSFRCSCFFHIYLLFSV